MIGNGKTLAHRTNNRRTYPVERESLLVGGIVCHHKLDQRQVRPVVVVNGVHSRLIATAQMARGGGGSTREYGQSRKAALAASAPASSERPA